MVDVEEPDRSLVLRLYGRGDDIQGEACTGQELPRPFSSWIEMVGLIERWRADQLGRGESAGGAEAGPRPEDRAP